MRRAIPLALVCACGSSATTARDAPPAVDAPPGTPDAAPDAPPDAGPRAFPDVTLALQPIATGVKEPTVITVPPGESRYFVAGKDGTISVIENGQARDPVFAKLTVLDSGEEGLLGMAFHPGYASNGRLFVYFTAGDRSERIWELHRGADPSTSDGTHKEILVIPHDQASNHNGGNILFGPDGMLYIGVGDGGGGFGQFGTTRVLTTRLSKMLRIDIDHGDPYQSPPDNPFASMDSAEAKDVWLWGLRNPWRWSFDRQTGDLWIGDVGQDCFEEVDFIPAGQKGLDLGWNAVEGINHCPVSGDQCGQPGACSVAGALVPVMEYDHGFGNAIVGGYVYRGAAIPALRGMYFFSDNGTSFVRSFWADQPVPMAQTKNWSALKKGSIATFGEDLDGELLLCSIGGNTCWKIVSAGGS